MKTTRRLAATTVALTLTATLWPSDALAQRARARGAHPPRIAVGAYSYRPLAYDPWFRPYGWYQPYAFGPFDVRTASLRLQVTPRETEVFIDGYYAGIVDDFDGFFQRLRLEPGEHDIQLDLAGYRPVQQKLLLQPDTTFRMRHTMEALAPGEAPPPRPEAAPSSPAPREARRGPDRDGPVTPDPSFGAIAIRVQPENAEVLIDGDRWEGPAIGEALVVQVAPGLYRIEVRKDGYRSYSSEVDVRAGRTTPVNISLPRQ